MIALKKILFSTLGITLPCFLFSEETVYVTGDLLWWTAREEGLEFATKGISDLFIPDPDAPNSSLQKPDWKWDFGFKVGIGANFPCDCWDFFLEYTWFCSRSGLREIFDLEEDFNAPPSNNRLLPLWVVGGVGGSQFRKFDPFDTRLRAASGKWSLWFHVLDLEIGKNFSLSQCLSFRPFFGLKGTWQKQLYEVTYEDRIIDFGSREINIIDMVQRQWVGGGGVLLGINSDWHFFPSWSLFGDLAISPLFTKFDLRRKDKRTRFLETTELTNSGLYFNVRDDFYSLKGVVELNLGIRWETWFGCNCNYHFLLQIGWEQQLWLGQNNFIDRVRAAHGDLSLYGLTAKAHFGF